MLQPQKAARQTRYLLTKHPEAFMRASARRSTAAAKNGESAVKARNEKAREMKDVTASNVEQMATLSLSVPRPPRYGSQRVRGACRRDAITAVTRR
jgi:hypothetical protein